MLDRRSFIRHSALAGTALGLGISSSLARSADDIKVGIIGLDTSHSPAFTKIINDPKNPKMQGIKVTHAYPYGSTKIEVSASRIPQYTKEIKELGVQVMDSLDALISASDVILLETNDGTLHLEQIMPVLKAKKPVFVDKPVAARLVDVIRIYKRLKSTMFRCSRPHRFDTLKVHKR
jgi:predicted dehydrogenase